MATRRKRGGQVGNTNAVTHGFYAKALTAAQQALLLEAAALDTRSLEEEIALARTRIRALIVADPDNQDLFIESLQVLARVMRIHADLSAPEEDGLEAAIQGVLDRFFPDREEAFA